MPSGQRFHPHALIQNFERGEELGAACCIYHRGEKVVDLWGGTRDASTGESWEEDTMVLVYSTTKGMAGMAMALAHSRGLYDYDARVSTYWPVSHARQAPMSRAVFARCSSHGPILRR